MAAPLAAQQPGYGAGLIELHIAKGPSRVVSALVRDSALLLPLGAIAELAEIRSAGLARGARWSAVLEPEGQPLVASTEGRFLRRGELVWALGDLDAVWESDELYLSPIGLERVLNVSLDVDWTNLTVLIRGAEHLPVIRRLVREQRRDRLLARSAGLVPVELAFDPAPVADGAVLDWALVSSLRDPLGATGVELAFGAELAGGGLRIAHTERRDLLPHVLGATEETTIGLVRLRALDREESEFVRPALVRALAAQGSDTRVRDRLLVEVGRGQDFFRSAVIEALGDYRAVYAVEPLIKIARQGGPLQEDAVIALGKLKDKRAMETLASLQRSAEQETQPAIAAAICLLGVNCDSHLPFVIETLKFAISNTGYQQLLRSAVSALVSLANGGNAHALTALFDAGIPSADPARAPMALGTATVAPITAGEYHHSQF